MGNDVREAAVGKRRHRLMASGAIVVGLMVAMPAHAQQSSELTPDRSEADPYVIIRRAADQVHDVGAVAHAAIVKGVLRERLDRNRNAVDRTGGNPPRPARNALRPRVDY